MALSTEAVTLTRPLGDQDVLVQEAIIRRYFADHRKLHREEKDKYFCVSVDGKKNRNPNTTLIKSLGDMEFVIEPYSACIDQDSDISHSIDKKSKQHAIVMRFSEIKYSSPSNASVNMQYVTMYGGFFQKHYELTKKKSQWKVVRIWPPHGTWFDSGAQHASTTSALRASRRRWLVRD